MLHLKMSFWSRRRLASLVRDLADYMVDPPEATEWMKSLVLLEPVEDWFCKSLSHLLVCVVAEVLVSYFLRGYGSCSVCSDHCSLGWIDCWMPKRMCHYTMRKNLNRSLLGRTVGVACHTFPVCVQFYCRQWEYDPCHWYCHHGYAACMKKK